VHRVGGRVATGRTVHGGALDTADPLRRQTIAGATITAFRFIVMNGLHRAPVDVLK
jgi:hypothetical protein